MMKFLKHEEIKEPKGEGKPSEPQTPPKPETPPSNPPAQAQGDKELDEFGYEKVPKAPEAGTKDKKPESDKKVEPPENVGGYGSKKIDPPKEDDPAQPPKEEPKDAKETLGYELDLKDFNDDEKKSIVEFAAKNKLSKEVAEAFVNLERDKIKEFETSVKERERKLATQKASWDKELREDKTFGGENMDKSLLQVDKVLSEFMPETKKVLTDNKRMLPPYVMKELLAVSKQLYGTESLTQGDPTKAPQKDDEKEGSPLDFYN